MNTILLDLDGTLLPMDIDIFTKAYFGALSKRCVAMGYDGEQCIAAVWAGTKAMMANDGVASNETRFWQVFAATLGDEVLNLKEEFEDFYRNEFAALKDYTLPNPYALDSMALLKEKGYGVVLATNPLFPMTGMRTRLEWLGLTTEDFLLVTSYENSYFCKPHPGYYRHIIETIGKEAADCLMVGNDPEEDMCAEEIGIETFLVTDCTVNKSGIDVSPFRQGSFEDFYAFVCSLPVAE